MMPRDTNPSGTIFGGVLLSYIDQAGGIVARMHAPHRVVTVAIDRVEFKQPVHVGDILSFFATVVHRGRTSITVVVDVTAERLQPTRQTIPVTEAKLVYVSVDAAGRPTPLGPEPQP